MQREFKKKLGDWKEKIGRDEAQKRLILEGLSLSIVQKLLAGCYPHQPVGLHLKAIERAMEPK